MLGDLGTISRSARLISEPPDAGSQIVTTPRSLLLASKSGVSTLSRALRSLVDASTT